MSDYDPGSLAPHLAGIKSGITTDAERLAEIAFVEAHMAGLEADIAQLEADGRDWWADVYRRRLEVKQRQVQMLRDWRLADTPDEPEVDRGHTARADRLTRVEATALVERLQREFGRGGGPAGRGPGGA